MLFRSAWTEADLLADFAAAPEIRAALADPNPEVRVSATFALAGLRDPAALPRLQSLLAHPEFPVRDWAAGMLTLLGEKGNAMLLEELRSPVVSRRQVAALNLLVGPAPPEPDFLIGALVNERDPAVQSSLLVAFARGKPRALCRGLADSLERLGAELRAKAVGVLMMCDDLSPEPIVAALADADRKSVV